MLEVDIDVRWLIALTRDEALEEQSRATLWIHGGDTEAIAHAGIRGGTPALTQNALATRVADDVVNGQEVRLVTQIGNQSELVLDGGTLALGNTVRPAPACTLLGELA